MPKPIIAIVIASSAALLLVGCHKGSATATTTMSRASIDTPEGFLEWSMDKYQKANAFSATCDYKIDSQGFGMHGDHKRSFVFQAPNKYKVTVSINKTVDLYCISDGTNEVDYSTDPKSMASKTAAPSTISAAQTPVMTNPEIAGTLLYKFFAGPANIGMLEKQDGSVASWGPEGQSPSGEKTKTVNFSAAGAFGQAKVTIGATTGLVYRIEYDSEPVVEQLLKGLTPQQAIDQLKSKLPSLPKGPQKTAVQKDIDAGPGALSVLAVETYDKPTFDATPSTDTFLASVPKGKKLVPAAPDGKPPVTVGQRAPDITVQDPSGKQIKLSSLRGRVVLIDFWATWCGPCKEGLPLTAALDKRYADKGLKVLAVSSEKPEIVAAFTKQQSYHLNPYLDPQAAATLAYHVSVLPTSVIIDAQGNLSDYSTGLQPPSAIAASLERAGLKVG